ncbi:MAG: hypothetical protein E6G57_15480 [Actinobacteria bacterium]|nr:MAG: hypothetical protein E6G57_15480 [Actinomycetota bacterium]
MLGLAVLVAVGSVVGLIAARDDLDRLHFLAPASVVSPVLVALAVVVREALDVLNPILSQATARAQRVREHGDWRLTGEERR